MQNKVNSENIFSKSIIFLSTLILFIIIFFQITSPIFFSQNKKQSDVIKKVEKLSSKIDLVSNQPSVVLLTEEILIKLKSENALQAEIYKDAKNGDYAVVSGNFMGIYSSKQKKLVYDDLTPFAIYNQNIDIYANKTISALKKEKKIDENVSPNKPILKFISDETSITTTKEIDPEFYAGLTTGDIVANFSELNIVAIYRPSEDKLIKAGTFNTKYN